MTRFLTEDEARERLRAAGSGGVSLGHRSNLNRVLNGKLHVTDAFAGAAGLERVLFVGYVELGSQVVAPRGLTRIDSLTQARRRPEPRAPKPPPPPKPDRLILTPIEQAALDGRDATPKRELAAIAADFSVTKQAVHHAYGRALRKLAARKLRDAG